MASDDAPTDPTDGPTAFRTWIATVRDPATRATEGVRTLRAARGRATAAYEIAPLPDGRCALTYHLSYHTGSCHGRGSPWTAYPTRAACVDAFLAAAGHLFGLPLPHPVGGVRAGQRTRREARRRMLALLAGDGLFGFEEPEPMPRPCAEWPAA